MERADGLSVISGMEALKLLTAFAGDAVGTGRRYHADLGKAVLVRSPLSRRAEGRRYFVTADKQIAEKILNDPARFRTVGVALTRGPKGSAQRRLRNGIVRMNGPQQQALRRAYAPPLSKSSLCQHLDALREICSAELRHWPRHVCFDAGAPAMRLANKAAAHLLFGSEDDPRALKIADIIGQHSRMQYSLKSYLFPVNLPGTPYHTLLKHAEITEAALIDWMAGQPEAAHSLVSCIAHMADIKGEAVDAQGRAAQLWTLYGASFDTTATTLRWLLLHLAWNRPVQDRLIEEVRAQGLESPYLDAVVLECLRMSPPVAYQMRRMSATDEVEGLALHRGDHIVISAAVINRDPGDYDAPNRFRPERWLTRSATPMQPLAFSAGPRRCLGFNFAMMVLRTCLCELFSETQVEVPGAAKIGVRLAITQGPKRVPIRLTPARVPAPQSRFTGQASHQMSE